MSRALTELLKTVATFFSWRSPRTSGPRLWQRPIRDAKSDDLEAAERGVREHRMWDERWTPTASRSCFRNYENLRWDNVSNRCLTCAMVCRRAFARRSKILPISREIMPSGGGAGLVFYNGLLVSGWRRGAQSGAFTLSTMDDAQARDLDRPVWQFGLCGLWAMHHVVPSGH